MLPSHRFAEGRGTGEISVSSSPHIQLQRCFHNTSKWLKSRKSYCPLSSGSCARASLDPPSPQRLKDRFARRTLLLSVGVIPITPDVIQTTSLVQGTCTECVGIVDGTLGTCDGFSAGTCVSTFDDRPPFFVAPWEYPGDISEAIDDLKEEISALGGKIITVEGGYIYATFGNACACPTICSLSCFCI